MRGRVRRGLEGKIGSGKGQEDSEKAGAMAIVPPPFVGA